MSASLRSHASVRSYYFREKCAEYGARSDRFDLTDFRVLWREADRQALTWRRRATTLWNDQTKQWEQRP